MTNANGTVATATPATPAKKRNVQQTHVMIDGKEVQTSNIDIQNIDAVRERIRAALDKDTLSDTRLRDLISRDGNPTKVSGTDKDGKPIIEQTPLQLTRIMLGGKYPLWMVADGDPMIAANGGNVTEDTVQAYIDAVLSGDERFKTRSTSPRLTLTHSEKLTPEVLAALQQFCEEHSIPLKLPASATNDADDDTSADNAQTPSAQSGLDAASVKRSAAAEAERQSARKGATVDAK